MEMDEIIKKINQIYGKEMSNVNIERIMERINKYNELSQIGKNLMMLIYGDMENYMKDYGNELEKYIIAFDKNMEDDSVVCAIGSRIGIYIPINEMFSAAEYFIDKIVEYIKVMGYNFPEKDEYQYKNKKIIPSTDEIINMDRNIFDENMKEYGLKGTEELYQDRLMVYKEIFETDEYIK